MFIMFHQSKRQQPISSSLWRRSGNTWHKLLGYGWWVGFRMHLVKQGQLVFRWWESTLNSLYSTAGWISGPINAGWLPKGKPWYCRVSPSGRKDNQMVLQSLVGTWRHWTSMKSRPLLEKIKSPRSGKGNPYTLVSSLQCCCSTSWGLKATSFSHVQAWRWINRVSW